MESVKLIIFNCLNTLKIENNKSIIISKINEFQNEYNKVFVSDSIYSLDNSGNELHVDITLIGDFSNFNNFLQSLVPLSTELGKEIYVMYCCNTYVVRNSSIITLNYANISSPTLDEINRDSKITITQADAINGRFKCNLSNLELIKTKGTNNEPWFIAQGNEASSYCEITLIDNDGWIYYSTAWLGSMNMNVGATVEFFNPFINYEILNNQCPTLSTARSNNNTFSGYPTTLNGKSFNYLMTGGLIKKQSDSKYRNYINATGSGECFIAEDTDINGNFTIISQTPFFDGIQYPAGRIKGLETLMWGTTPCLSKDMITLGGKYIGLLAVKDGNISNTYLSNYTGYVILDFDGNIIDNKIYEAVNINTVLADKSSWTGGWHITGLALFENNWHLIVKNWNQTKLSREEWHIILKSEVKDNLITALSDGKPLTDILNLYIDSCILLHRGSDYSSTPSKIFYGQSDFQLFVYNDQLYTFFFFEPIQRGTINSMNRMCGLGKWDSVTQTWDYKKGLQIINPIQLYKKYPHLQWCWDHLGNLACPYIEDNILYLGIGMASNDPDYFPAIIKLNLKLSSNDLEYKPKQVDYAQSDNTKFDYIKNKPELFSGDYNDLLNKPADISQTTYTSSVIIPSSKSISIVNFSCVKTGKLVTLSFQYNFALSDKVVDKVTLGVINNRTLIPKVYTVGFNSIYLEGGAWFNDNSNLFITNSGSIQFTYNGNAGGFGFVNVTYEVN